MKFIKKFESFDFSQTLPFTSKDNLTLYYSCDDCNALYKSLNEIEENCRYCKSENLEELSPDEWYDSVSDRLDEDEIDELQKERQGEENTFVDLLNLKKSNIYVN
jgi:hypothetical protein